MLLVLSVARLSDTAGPPKAAARPAQSSCSSWASWS